MDSHPVPAGYLASSHSANFSNIRNALKLKKTLSFTHLQYFFEQKETAHFERQEHIKLRYTREVACSGLNK